MFLLNWPVKAVPVLHVHACCQSLQTHVGIFCNMVDQQMPQDLLIGFIVMVRNLTNITTEPNEDVGVDSVEP